MLNFSKKDAQKTAELITFEQFEHLSEEKKLQFYLEFGVEAKQEGLSCAIAGCANSERVRRKGPEHLKNKNKNLGHLSDHTQESWAAESEKMMLVPYCACPWWPAALGCPGQPYSCTVSSGCSRARLCCRPVAKDSPESLQAYEQQAVDREKSFVFKPGQNNSPLSW